MTTAWGEVRCPDCGGELRDGVPAGEEIRLVCAECETVFVFADLLDMVLTLTSGRDEIAQCADDVRFAEVEVA